MRASVDPILLLQDLIRCPSVTPNDGGAFGILAAILEEAGFETETIAFSEPDTADVVNFFAKFGRGAPHLAFFGHVDVVPPGDTTLWRHPPFAGIVEDGLLYGRGAVDMKGGIACFAAAALRFVATRRAGQGAVSLLLTADEEGPAINGTAKLLDWAASRGERFEAALVGEPTSREAVGDTIKVGRRGSLSGTVVVHGRQGHVAYPHLAENPIPPLARLVQALSAPPLDSGTETFDPSNLEWVSLEAENRAWNVIPGEARGRFNVRYNDAWTPASLEAEIRRRLAASGMSNWSLVLEPQVSDVFVTSAGPLVDALAASVESVTGRRPDLSTSGGTSDARFVKNYCPVVELGLVGRTMHQIDECVALDDLARLTDIYRAFLDRFFA